MMTSKPAWITASGAASAGIQVSFLTLTEGALHAMFVHRLKPVMISVGLAALTMGAGSVLHARAEADQPVQETREKAKNETAKQREALLQAYFQGVNNAVIQLDFPLADL